MYHVQYRPVGFGEWLSWEQTWMDYADTETAQLKAQELNKMGYETRIV